MASSNLDLCVSSILGFPLLLVFLTPPDPGVDFDVLLPGVSGVFCGVLGALGVFGPPIWLK